MKFSVIVFVSFCITFVISTGIINPVPAVPVSSHAKSINIPYRSPVHITGFYPATTILEAPVLKSHSYTTEIKHLAPVAVASPVVPVHGALAPVKSIGVVGPAALGPVKSSGLSIATEVRHEVPVLTAPIVPVEVAPAIVPAEGPIKSSAIKAFSFATEVKHEVPVAAAPVVVSPIITEPVVKSIHAPATAPVIAYEPAVVPAIKSINAPVIAPPVVAHAAAIAPAPVPVVAHAEGPVKSSAIKAFSFAAEVRHDVPVAAAPIVSAPQFVTHAEPAVKSIHAPIRAPAPLVKSIHAPVIASNAPVVPIVSAPQVVTHVEPVVKSIHAPAPLAKSIHTPVFAPNAPVVPLTNAIHSSVLGPVPHIAPLAKSIHSSAIAHAPAIAPVTKSIHSSAIAPAIRAPLVKPYISALRHRLPLAVGAHAPVLSAAGLIGAGVTHPARLVHRLPVAANIHHGIYGGGFGSHQRLYASLVAPGAVLWRGQPVSSGVAYLGGISRGAFGYHPIPVHYQGYRSPVHGVWNYYRG